MPSDCRRAKRGPVEAIRCAHGARDAHAADVLFYIDAARKGGCMSLGKIAKAPTARGIETPAGGREWHVSPAPATVAAASPAAASKVEDAIRALLASGKGIMTNGHREISGRGSDDGSSASATSSRIRDGEST